MALYAGAGGPIRFSSGGAARHSCQANAIVYDFLSEDKKKNRKMCAVFDVPGADRRELADYFCREISGGAYDEIRFAFDRIPQTPRVILSGDPAQVMALLQGYMEDHL